MSATEPSVNADRPSVSVSPRISEGSFEPASASGPKQELASRRDKLTERFALLQSELGGLFYEMAIRDHLQLDLLIARASALQRVEDELRRVERELAQS